MTGIHPVTLLAIAASVAAFVEQLLVVPRVTVVAALISNTRVSAPTCREEKNFPIPPPTSLNTSPIPQPAISRATPLCTIRTLNSTIEESGEDDGCLHEE